MANPSAQPPDFFTIEEAARVLRIGRTAAYALARRWRATDGTEGLPVVAFGRLLRVPRAVLEEMCGGPIATPVPAAQRTAAGPVPDEEPKPAAVEARVSAMPVPRRRHRRTRAASPDQTILPFD